MRRLLTAVLLVALFALSGCAAPPVTPATAVTVNYAGTTDPEQSLDLYRPAGSGPAPVVVFLHGGAWTGGDKSWVAGGTPMRIEALRAALVAHGYAVAAVNYRLAPATTYPGFVDDVEAAVRYLRGAAASLGLDPTKIAIAGESAGAHIAQLAALTATDPASGATAAGAQVEALVSFYGVSDPRALLADTTAAGCAPAAAGIVRQITGLDPATPAGRTAAAAASPITHVSAQAPPTLLLHGRRDCTVPAVQSERLASALTAAGARAELVEIDADHGASAFYVDPAIQARVIDFLDAALGRR